MIDIVGRILKWREGKADKKKEKAARSFYVKSQSVFQIRECNGEMWFTYDGDLICPCSFFKENAINVLNELRRLYFVNNFRNEQ